MRTKGITVISALITLSTSDAAKPDWPAQEGTGTIGFGLIQLSPNRDHGSTYTFNYDIPAKYAAQAPSGQIIVLKAEAFEKYNNIPTSQFLAHNKAETLSNKTGLHMSAQVEVSEPGLYVVCYGPWSGLLTFDEALARETYKISARTQGDSQFRWIDQDAGDITIFKNAKGEFEIRLRLVRSDLNEDHKSDLTSGPDLFKVHPTAAARTKLLKANW